MSLTADHRPRQRGYGVRMTMKLVTAALLLLALSAAAPLGHHDVDRAPTAATVAVAGQHVIAASEHVAAAGEHVIVSSSDSSALWSAGCLVIAACCSILLLALTFAGRRAAHRALVSTSPRDAPRRYRPSFPVLPALTLTQLSISRT
ncbi:hypothetical protein [Microbacterium sp. cx-59]|uniref:hypothetical protein n=1 Tax=Microbacterium sp. cx-59 TaxID=2891207 RepID=UPI001E386EEA|nr:hypothetical protein [Microbacterium sp. cx-59]MCC4907020.1 hypothetical protein [Microbacterium sp. cx-59]